MRPRRILRSSCWVSLGTGCLRHPQLVRLTSTLRGDARSATKFCPGGSPGGSSASAPLRRRPGEGKHSLPPPASLYKGVLLASPGAPELWGLKEQPPPLTRLESYGCLISPLISFSLTSWEMREGWFADPRLQPSIAGQKSSPGSSVPR